MASPDLVVSSINIHPVKSCGGFSVTAWPVGARGLLHDREWLVVNEAKRFCTGRNFPQMLTLSCSPFEPNRDLDAATLAATTASELPPFIRIVATLDDTVPPLYLPLDERYLPTTELSTAPLPEAPHEAHVVEVVVWRSTCEAEDMGDVAAQWFSHLLHQPVRLVRATARVRPRLVGDEPKKHVLCVAPESDITAFADGYPFLLGSEESLADLNARLPAGTGPLPMTRFRPNIVVRHAPQPWAEDRWRRLRIGNLTYHGVAACARCKMTTIDSTRGESPSSEPLDTLQSFRRVISPYSSVADPRPQYGVMFGWNMIHERPADAPHTSNAVWGHLALGDVVHVLEHRDPVTHVPQSASKSEAE